MASPLDCLPLPHLRPHLVKIHEFLHVVWTQVCTFLIHNMTRRWKHALGWSRSSGHCQYFSCRLLLLKPATQLGLQMLQAKPVFAGANALPVQQEKAPVVRHSSAQDWSGWPRQGHCQQPAYSPCVPSSWTDFLNGRPLHLLVRSLTFYL